MSPTDNASPAENNGQCDVRQQERDVRDRLTVC